MIVCTFRHITVVDNVYIHQRYEYTHTHTHTNPLLLLLPPPPYTPPPLSPTYTHTHTHTHTHTSILTFFLLITTSGFSVATKMLQLFRRPDDPEEFFNFYLLPIAILCGGVAAGAYFDLPQVTL